MPGTDKARREQHRESGICVYCSCYALPGRVMCEAHQELNRDYVRKWRLRKAKGQKKPAKKYTGPSDADLDALIAEQRKNAPEWFIREDLARLAADAARDQWNPRRGLVRLVIAKRWNGRAIL